MTKQLLSTRNRFPIFNSAIALLLLLGQFTPARQPNAYLKGQQEAMRDAYVQELDTLEDAPRYTLRAQIDPEGETITGSLSLLFTNTSDQPVDHLVFRLYPNANTIYGGGSLDIRHVSQWDIALPYTLSEDKTTLSVFPLYPIQPGGLTIVDISFLSTLPQKWGKGYGIFKKANFVLCLAGWYPILAPLTDDWQVPDIPLVGDAMYTQTSLYEAWLTLPPGYTVASSGTIVDRQAQNQLQNVWHIVTGPAREFALAISNRYQVYTTHADDVTIHFYTQPVYNAQLSEKYGLESIADIFQFFNTTFGPYPFTEFEVAETVVSTDGFEFSGMVFMDTNGRAALTARQYRYFLAHEIAHQWWYGLVGSNPIEEPWVDEAMATYAAILYLEHADGISTGQQFIRSWTYSFGLLGPSDLPVSSPASAFYDWPTYDEAIYIHGAVFLDQIRQRMGTDAFLELLRDYQQTYRYRIANASDFIELAKQHSTQNLDDIFNYWLQDGT